MIGRRSGAKTFNTDKFSEVLGLRGIEKIVSKRNDLVVDALFYFEPLQRFEYRADMFSFRVPDTARTRKFCSNWRRDIWFSFR